MKAFLLRTLAIGVATTLLFTGNAKAQTTPDMGGTWQGTLPVGKGVRLLLKISPKAQGWSGVIYNLDSDSPSDGMNTTAVSFSGGQVRFTVAPIGAEFEGRMAPDGASIAGTWTQGGQPHTLTLARATADTEWQIPKPTAQMASDADPDWEVVTVRRTDPTVTNASIRMDGRQFQMMNRSVETLLLVDTAFTRSKS